MSQLYIFVGEILSYNGQLNSFLYFYFVKLQQVSEIFVFFAAGLDVFFALQLLPHNVGGES